MPKAFRIFPILFLFCSYALAQSFQYRPVPGVNSMNVFREQFQQWADSTDINAVKGWKMQKRWEHDMLMHSDGKGEPGDAGDFLRYQMQKSASSRSSSAFSANWFPVGPYNIPSDLTGYLEVGIGRMNCMTFHPTNPQILYVGVAQGGVWKSENGGQSWAPLTDNLPMLRISDIDINPLNPDEIYISVGDYAYLGINLETTNRKRHTHYGLGVFKTTNGGTSWEPTALTFEQTDGDGSLICDVILHPENPQTIVAAGETGIYRSTDGGDSWTQMLDTLMWDLISDPQNPNVLYAASGWVKNSDDGFAGIFKSTDFGLTWSLLNTGIPTTGLVQRIKLDIPPQNSNRIYAVAVDEFSGYYGLYRSDNAGSSWSFTPAPLNVLDGGQGDNIGGQGTYDLTLLTDSENQDRIFVGGVNLWASDDAGQSFNPVAHWTTFYGPTIHADQHHMYRHPLTGEYFMVNDGGVYKTSEILTQTWDDAFNGSPWPSNWTNLNNGMNVTSFYRLSSSKNSTGRLVSGAQDNSTFYFDGNEWFSIFGGDGMDNYLSPGDDFHVLGSSQFGNFYLSYDGGFSSDFVTSNPLDEESEWTTPVVAAPSQAGRLYLGNETVVVSDDDGQNWTMGGAIPGTGEPLTALGVSPTNANLVFAASKVDYLNNLPLRVFRSNNGSQSWVNVTGSLPDSLYATGIALNSVNPSEVFICFAGFSDGAKVYRSTNSGSTWTNVSYNLPNVPVNMVTSLPGSRDLLAATDAGVFLLRADSTSWIEESMGLPNVIVSDIEINEALNKVYVSTFGRGIWATDLDLFTKNRSTAFTQQPLQLLNPSNDRWLIQWGDGKPMPKRASLEVIDIQGRVVYRADVSQQSSVEFNSSAWSFGVYFARLSADGLSRVERFVVRR